MIVNAKQMLETAVKGKYAVAQININNLEWAKAAITTAQEQKSPLIVGVTGGAARYMGSFNVVAAMVKALDRDLGITVPVAIHLDHGSYEECLACIEAGFTSIMFDGSHFPFEENMKKTSEMISLARKNGMTIEAEVGAIGGEEDGVVGSGDIADPEECRKIAALGVDFLAAGIGNIHGSYPADWPGLDFDVLEQVSKVTGGIPLVLHGGTGIEEDMIKKAISLGVAKINVNTECQLAFAAATREYIEAGLDKKDKGFDPRKLLAPGAAAIKKAVKDKFELFGSVGKA
ncbi:MAG: class II fructose-1,6-bisphosphate aldolase [Defluviitaleaceae bacterium]|nr:class II fructose-1,6-bisphosphate aldolase [Defluviitaleaceae bacterium]